MQIASDWLESAELPLREYRVASDWPESLRSDSRVRVFFTRLERVGCQAALLVAPRGSTIAIAPTSAYWKHKKVMDPTPVQGGALQLDWLTQVHGSTRMAAAFRQDLKTAGHAHSFFRRGLLPYEGGACFGLPPIGVSPKAGPDLSPYTFRSYLLPLVPQAENQFLRELDQLFGTLKSWALRAYDANSVNQTDFEEWGLIRQGSEPLPSPNAKSFALVGNEQRGLNFRERATHIRQLAQAVENRTQHWHEEVDADRPHPLLADFAIRMPVALTLPAAIRRNMSGDEVVAHKELQLANSELFIRRAQLLCQLRWPTFYWAAYDGVRTVEDAPSAWLGVEDSVEKLKQLSSELQSNHRVLSVEFLEAVWRSDT